MIINRTPVSFAGRAPSPRYIPVGVVGDNLVECVEFRLPTIDEHQTATMLLNGKYADAITLERKGDIYCAEITADIVGASGRLDAYIRINGNNGPVWNSEPFILCVCDVPDTNEEVEKHSLTVFDQMLNAIATHNAEMSEQKTEVEGIASEAAESAKNADTSATAAATSEGNAQKALEETRTHAEAAESAKGSAAASEAAAGNSAERSEAAADRAEQMAATNGYVFFEVNDNGHLIMTKTENVGNLDFRLNEGRLEVIYG